MVSTDGVDDDVHAKPLESADEEHRPIGRVIGDAVERSASEEFWRGVQDDFARLRSDPIAWSDYQQEAAEWEAAADVGLEAEEPYYTADEEAEIDAQCAGAA